MSKASPHAIWAALTALSAAGLAAGLSGCVDSHMRAECNRKPVHLVIAGHRLTAEVAACDADLATGLMGRDALQTDHGILFVFPDERVRCMWMKQTAIPLSVAFIDRGGTILHIEDMQPHTTVKHCSRGPVRYALEMQQGWFAAKGIRSGESVPLD